MVCYDVPSLLIFIPVPFVKGRKVYHDVDGFGGLVVSVLASGTRVCGFKPGRSLKNLPHAFLRRESERICTMSQLCGM